MERQSQAYAKASSFIRGRLRFLSGADAPVSFTSAGGASIVSREELIRQANLSESFANFLIGLDAKLETILSMMRKETLEDDFPFKLETLEVSGAGIRFTTEAPIMPNSYLEVILFLGDYPSGIIGAVGKVQPEATPAGQHNPQEVYDPGAHPWTLNFTRIREPDLDAIVQFVFQEERRRIREHRFNG